MDMSPGKKRCGRPRYTLMQLRPQNQPKVSLYIGFFLAICIFIHIPWILEMIWRAFSILHCIVTSFSCTLTICIFLLALSAKPFCDCKYLSTIACASEDTFGESTAAKFLLDNSPLFDMYGVPSRLLSDYSLHVHLHSVCSIFQLMFCLPLSHLSPYHLFYELYQVSVAACHFSS